MKGGLWRRLPAVAVIVLGVWLYRGGLGIVPAERSVLWRLPVAAGDVRAVDLQIWSGDDLIKREELSLPSGLQKELTQQVMLKAGPHRALATVTLAGAAAPKVWQQRFDPKDDEHVLLMPTPVAP